MDSIRTTLILEVFRNLVNLKVVENVVPLSANFEVRRAYLSDVGWHADRRGALHHDDLGAGGPATVLCEMFVLELKLPFHVVNAVVDISHTVEVLLASLDCLLLRGWLLALNIVVFWFYKDLSLDLLDFRRVRLNGDQGVFSRNLDLLGQSRAIVMCDG